MHRDVELFWGLGITTLRRNHNTPLVFEPHYWGRCPRRLDDMPNVLSLAVTRLTSQVPCISSIGVNHLPQDRTAWTSSRIVQLAQHEDPLERLQKRRLTLVITDVRQSAAAVEEIYLRLFLMSTGLLPVTPSEIPAMKAHLPLVAWTDAGPLAQEDVAIAKRELGLKHARTLQIDGISRIPDILHFVSPSEAEIAHGARVQLGARIGPGTIIESGSVVLAGTSIGRDCRIGPNASTEISLGNHCIIGPGIHVEPHRFFYDMRGSPNRNSHHALQVRASVFGGTDRIRFTKSATGQLEVHNND